MVACGENRRVISSGNRRRSYQAWLRRENKALASRKRNIVCGVRVYRLASAAWHRQNSNGESASKRKYGSMYET